MIFKELTELQDEYCKECFIKKQFRKEYGKTYAHAFCIKNVRLVKSLHQYGECLNQSQKHKNREAAVFYCFDSSS